MVTVVSALYGNCQVQVFFQTLADLFGSVAGFTGLAMRTAGGLQRELPFYVSKAMLSSSPCIIGESAGKMTQLIFAYSI